MKLARSIFLTVILLAVAGGGAQMWCAGRCGVSGSDARHVAVIKAVCCCAPSGCCCHFQRAPSPLPLAASELAVTPKPLSDCSLLIAQSSLEIAVADVPPRRAMGGEPNSLPVADLLSQSCILLC